MAIASAIIGAGIAAAGSIAGSVIGGNASKKAAQAQADGARYAADLQNQQYQQSRADAEPWRIAGGKAIGSLSDMLQPGYDHTTSPGYQFRMDEGMRALEGSAAARGSLMSGNTLKDVIRYSQGVAADDFGGQFNRTASVAAGGQQVNQSLGALGAAAAGNAGNAMMQGANARASGYVGQANALTGGLSNLATIAMTPGLFGGGGGSAGAFSGGLSNPSLLTDVSKFNAFQ